MQTFLPDCDFERAARILDNKRLGKQRVEAYQILRALAGLTKGWRNHPATLMWHGHEACLGVYLNACIDEWQRRGFVNTMSRATTTMSPFAKNFYPAWMLDHDIRDRVCDSHRSNLLRKDPEFYGLFGWAVPPDLPYYWPVTKAEVEIKRTMELCP